MYVFSLSEQKRVALQAGYNLIETMLIIAIVSVMSIIGVKMLSSQADAYKIEEAANTIKTLLDAAVEYGNKNGAWPTSRDQFPLLIRNSVKYELNPWGNAYEYGLVPDIKAPYFIATVLPTTGIAFKLQSRLDNSEIVAGTGRYLNAYSSPGVSKQTTQPDIVVKNIGCVMDMSNDPCGHAPTNVSGQRSRIQDPWPELYSAYHSDSSGNILEHYRTNRGGGFVTAGVEPDGDISGIAGTTGIGIGIGSRLRADYDYYRWTESPWKNKRYEDLQHPIYKIAKPTCDSGYSPEIKHFINAFQKGCFPVYLCFTTDSAGNMENIINTDECSAWLGVGTWGAVCSLPYVDGKYVDNESETGFLRRIAAWTYWTVAWTEDAGNYWDLHIQTGGQTPGHNSAVAEDESWYPDMAQSNYHGGQSYITYCKKN